MAHRTILQIENTQSRVVSTDKALLDTLHKKLRFRPKNFWHNEAYKRKKWDGWKNFFDPKTGKFLTGLLPEVRLLMRTLNKPFETIDHRGPVSWKQVTVDENFLNNWLPEGFDPITLYDYQPDLVKKCMQYNRGIVQAPTGAGKTFILISLLKCLPPKTPTLFVTKSASLVHQNYLEMEQWGVENLGRWYGKYKEPNYVMCVTQHTQTFNSIKKLLPKFKVLLVDEVHDCMSEVPIRAYKKMKNASVRIGFSATPFKWNKKKVDEVHKYTTKGHFGPVFKTDTVDAGLLTANELQKRGNLSPSDCSFYVIDRPDLAYEPYQDAVKLGIEQNFYFHDVVKRLTQTCPGRTLIVVDRIEHGEYLEQLIPGSQFIQGKNKLEERVPVLNALKKGERFTAIVMKQIITAGINIMIHDLINASGGEGAHNIVQLIGRGLRNADDKEMLRYHDFMFLMNDYLRKHSEWRYEVLGNEGHTVRLVETLPF
jgi:superfamily II DNA or RNA helicase